MTHEITEEELMADMALDDSLKQQIAEVFEDAVARKTEEALGAIDALNDAAELFAAVVEENAITTDELNDAFDFFVDEIGLEDEDDIEMLATFIGETFTVDEVEPDDNDELTERTGTGTAKMFASYMPLKNKKYYKYRLAKR
jgi:hypothetical protein